MKQKPAQYFLMCHCTQSSCLEIRAYALPCWHNSSQQQTKPSKVLAVQTQNHDQVGFIPGMKVGLISQNQLK
jgi:hypothetical protein